MRRHTIFRILTLLYLAAVAVLCFGNFQNLGSISRSWFGLPADKVVHFCMFLPFPVLTFFSFRLKRKGLVKVLSIIVGLLLVGGFLAWGTEYIQGLLPHRTMDAADFAADRLGLICGSILAFLLAVSCKSGKDA